MTTKATITIYSGQDTSNAVQLPDKVTEVSVFVSNCEGTPQFQVSPDNSNWFSVTLGGMASVNTVYTVKQMTQLSTCYVRVKLTSTQSANRSITLLYATASDYTLAAQVGL